VWVHGVWAQGVMADGMWVWDVKARCMGALCDRGQGLKERRSVRARGVGALCDRG